MSIHIAAKKSDIVETVLMPGDPMRAQYIANNYLQNAVCYNQVRGMFGYTGTYKGKKVSIQGSGMGIPSMSIYAHELINDYGVKKIIRIGSCGSLQKEVNIRDIVLAQASSSDTNINGRIFPSMTFCPIASFNLLLKAYNKAVEMGIKVNVGNVFTTDLFYDEPSDSWKVWSRYGVLAVEMETAGLYTLAARYNIEALSILTVSDHLITNEACTSEEREKTFNKMLELALELV
ncbi:MAG: purine-nucleoside phosphorylase [Oligoflexia bacterium]|nr:purine-nucleoside phosphorylase [Oligoflexia bacterium]